MRGAQAGRDTDPSDDVVVRLLHHRGLRVTRPRILVLHRLISAGGHHEAGDVVEAIRDVNGPVSVQAVYNVLATLTRVGLVRRIEPPGRPALYESRTGDNHHHLICRHCGAVANLDCGVDTVPCLQPSDDHQYMIDEAEICWYGVCAECQTRSAA